MSFIYPWFLLGLTAISIPILIHFFHFRRFKKVFFSSTDFLEKISEENERQSKLKHLLVLLARILAIASLVIAFSRPYIPLDESMLSLEGNAVCIYVDNSFSMEDESVSGSLLDLAKEKAREVAGIYSYTDEFILLTNDFEGRHQRIVSREEFLSLLNEVKVSPAVKTLSEVYVRQSELLQSAPVSNRTAYIISDFQKNISDFEEFNNVHDDRLILLPLQARNIDNVYLDTVWIESPVRIYNQTATLNVRVKNTSTNNLENQHVRLYISGVQRGVAAFDIPSGGYTDVQFTFKINEYDFVTGYVEITDYPITFDNKKYFSFNVTTGINVLSIHRELPGPFLSALFERDTLFNFKQMDDRAVDYSAFSQQNVIILNGLNDISSGLALEANRYVDNGGTLLILPGQSIDLDSYSNLLKPLNANYYLDLDTMKTKVTDINEQHIVFKDVFDRIPENIDLPNVNNYYKKTRLTQISSEDILIMQNGLSFLSSYSFGSGNVFLSSVGLNDFFSSFQRHPLFVPVVYNIAIQSASFQPLYHTIGSDKPVVLRNQVFSSNEILTVSSNGLEFIPQHRNVNNILHLYMVGQVFDAGIYNVKRNSEKLNVIAFNYDRRESETFFHTFSELKRILDDNNMDKTYVVDTLDVPAGEQLAQLQSGKQFWLHFLILGLAFILMEILLLRLFK